MKVYKGKQVQPHSFLTSALDGGKWSTSSPGRFTPEERQLYTLNRTEPVWTFWRREKFLAPTGIRTPKHPVPLLIAVVKVECVYYEVGTEMLNFRNIVMFSMLQSVHEMSISALVNIAENRNAVRRLV